jgi:hypothetical protein
MSLHSRSCLILLASAALLPAVTIGQVDTFEDGSTMGWMVPGQSPSPPVTVENGGPLGLGDAFLRLTALGGAGAGSRLSVLNEAQWSGDYLGLGITGIRMQVSNLGPDDLYLRLLFEDFAGPGPPRNLALSAQAVIVPAGSGWVTVLFPIQPNDLLAYQFGTVVGALSGADTLRIFHNPDPAFPGPGAGIPPVTAVLGVDNIVALVPEPGGVALVGGGLLLLVFRRIRR